MVEKNGIKAFLHDVAGEFTRADLEFYGINHYRPSYTVYVYFNDKRVPTDDVDEERPSYAGSFSVFGHATCAGDDGHCVVPLGQRRFDDRPSHPLTKAFKRVVVTDALRRAVNEGEKLSVTLMAFTDAEPDEVDGKLLEFEGMQLVTFH